RCRRVRPRRGACARVLAHGSSSGTVPRSYRRATVRLLPGRRCGYDPPAAAHPEGVRLMEPVLLAIAVGVGGGIVVGALGAGGGILAVPVLVFLLGMPPHAATASSLVIVLITALASLPHHARQRNVEWRAGLVFAAVSIAGAVVGSRLS